MSHSRNQMMISTRMMIFKRSKYFRFFNQSRHNKRLFLITIFIGHTCYNIVYFSTTFCDQTDIRKGIRISDIQPLFSDTRKIILKKRDMNAYNEKEKTNIAAFMGLRGMLKENITLDELRAERIYADLARHEHHT